MLIQLPSAGGNHLVTLFASRTLFALLVKIPAEVMCWILALSFMVDVSFYKLPFGGYMEYILCLFVMSERRLLLYSNVYGTT